MDIKRMHDMIEKLSEAAKSEIDKGIELADTEETSKVIDMLKDLAEAMYYRTLTKAMEESDTEETMRMFDRYGRERRDYDHYRYRDGRFAPKGHGEYRGYDESPYWHMTPEMYRDMDRQTRERMNYTETGIMHTGESNYDRAKRNYTESKDMHRANTPQDKEAKMKDLEKYMKELSSDLTELMAGMSGEEMAMAKSKLSTLLSKM